MINWKNVPTNLNNLKSKVDKLDVDKVVPVPVNLSKLKRWKTYIAYFVVKYSKFENSKISYLLEKALVLSIICSECKNEDKLFRKKESIEVLKISLIIYSWQYIITLTIWQKEKSIKISTCSCWLK